MSSSIPGVRALVGDTVVVLVSSLGGGFGSAAHCDTTSCQHPLVWTLSFVINVTTESQRTFSRTNGKSQPVCSRSNLPQGGDKEPLLTLHTHTHKLILQVFIILGIIDVMSSRLGKKRTLQMVSSFRYLWAQSQHMFLVWWWVSAHSMGHSYMWQHWKLQRDFCTATLTRSFSGTSVFILRGSGYLKNLKSNTGLGYGIRVQWVPERANVSVVYEPPSRCIVSRSPKHPLSATG